MEGIECWCFVIFILCSIRISSVFSNPTTSRPICVPGEEPDGKGGCKTCPAGFYSKNGTGCTKCTKCHTGQEETQSCQKSRNTRCLCGKGKYEKAGICKDCRNCPAGLFQKRDCGHNLDRQCEECPKGYSTNHTNAKKCLPNTHTKPPTIHVHNYSSNVNVGLIVGLVALAVFVVCSLALIVFCVRRRKRRRRNQMMINSNNNRRSCLEDEDTPMLPLTYTMPHEVDPRHTMWRDLTYDVVAQLSHKLNPNESNNWRTLAGHLKFTQEQVKNFDLDPKEATQNLLHEWSTNRVATVFIIHDILLNYMNRPEAAALLEPHIFKPEYRRHEHDTIV